MAFEAGASDLIRLVQGLALTAGGLVLGAAEALALTRLLVGLLYKVIRVVRGGDDDLLSGSVLFCTLGAHPGPMQSGRCRIDS